MTQSEYALLLYLGLRKMAGHEFTLNAVARRHFEPSSATSFYRWRRSLIEWGIIEDRNTVMRLTDMGWQALSDIIEDKPNA